MAIKRSQLFLRRASKKAAIAAVNTQVVRFKRRIFNKGEAVDSKIGTYRSRSYRKKRDKAGRQTEYKDLEFDGDLRRAIQTGERGDNVIIGFTTDRAKAIAGYQEEQTGKTIFKLNESEITAAKRAFARQYKKYLTQ